MLHSANIGRLMLHFIETHGQVALLTLLALEEAGLPLPIPGDLLVFYAGYRISQGQLSFFMAFLLSMFGVVVGGTILYFIFNRGGRPFLHKYGRYFLMPKERIKQLEEWFDKKAKYPVLIGRFVPGLRVFVSAFAGLLNFRYIDFIFQITVASSVWILIFLLLGIYLGKRFHRIPFVVNRLGSILFVIFIVTIVIFIFKEYSKNNKKKKISESTSPSKKG